MNGIQVVIDTDNLQRTGAGAVSGRIWLDCDGEPFPEAGWWDVPSVILGWWIDGLRDFSAGARVAAELRFMDGPFLVGVSRSGGDVIATVVDHDTVLFVLVDIDLRGLTDSAVIAAKEIVAACNSRGWVDDDVDRLDAMLRRT